MVLAHFIGACAIIRVDNTGASGSGGISLGVAVGVSCESGVMFRDVMSHLWRARWQRLRVHTVPSKVRTERVCNYIYLLASTRQQRLTLPKSSIVAQG